MTVKWNIIRVNSPTEKQLAASIFGSASLFLEDDDGSPLAYFNNILIRKNKTTHEKFLATPRSQWKDKDGQDRFQNHYNLLPLGDNESLHNSQKEKLRTITAEVVRLAESGGTPREPREDKPQAATQDKPEEAKAASPEPW